MWGFIRKQKHYKENSQEEASERSRSMSRQKQQTPLRRAGQTVVLANKRKRHTQLLDDTLLDEPDTPYRAPKSKVSRLEDDEAPDLLEEGKEGGEPATTIEEDMFWEADKQSKAAWAAEARRYKLPICTKSLRLSCPAKECIEKKNDMTPVYIECKSRQGGTYIAMMYCCNYCNAFAPTREDAQKNNVFAGHIVAKFVQNYIRRAKDCGIDDISTIPLPVNAAESFGSYILNQASASLPTVSILEEFCDKLREIHAIIVKEFKKKEEPEPSVFEKVELEEEVEKEEEVEY